MTERTPQETFDFVVRHLAKQGGKAVERSELGDVLGEVCVYRTEHGAACAVGCLIDDVDYSPHMEHNSVGGLYDVGILPPYLRDKLSLLKRLQVAHDASTTGVSLRVHLQEIAEDFDLNPAALVGVEFPDKWEPLSE